MSDDKKKKKRKVTKSAHIYSGRSGEVTKTIERGDKKGTVVKKKKFHGTYSGHEKTVKKEGKLSKYKFKSSSEDGNKHIKKQSKGRSVEKITDEKGNKIKSVERRSGKRVETIKTKNPKGKVKDPNKKRGRDLSKPLSESKFDAYKKVKSNISN